MYICRQETTQEVFLPSALQNDTSKLIVYVLTANAGSLHLLYGKIIAQILTPLSKMSASNNTMTFAI